MFEKLMTGALETYLTELMQHHRRDVSVNPIDRDVLLQYNVCGLAGTLLAFCGRPDLVQAAGPAAGKDLVRRTFRMAEGITKRMRQCPILFICPDTARCAG